MSTQYTAFYRGKTTVRVDFNAEQVSSDGAVVLLEKIEREYGYISHFSKFIPDCRDPSRITHSMEKLLKQRVFMLMQGYEDTNDVYIFTMIPCSRMYYREIWHHNLHYHDLRTVWINALFLSCVTPG